MWSDLNEQLIETMKGELDFELRISGMG